MANKYKVSIIVPVYKVSKYLRRCLETLINQTLKEIEIIIVNDASPDPEDDVICREYEAKDERIVYIKHKVNKNLGAARNTGLNVAKGEYIGFVDSDDWVDLDMFEILYTEAKETNFEIINCGATREYQSGRKPSKFNVNDSNKILVWDDLLSSFIRARAGETDKKFPSGVWNKLYKRSFLDKNKIRFEEGYYFEELMFSINTFYYCDKMALLPNNLYHWYIREGSISNTISQLHIDSIFYGYNYIRKFFQDRNIYSKENKGLIDKLFYKQLFDIYIYNNGEKVKPYIENIVDEIEKTFHNYDFVRFCILDKIKMKRMRSDLNLLKEKNNALEGEVKKIKEEKEACELSINKLKRSKWYRISKWLSKNPIYRGIRRVLSL